MKKIKSLGLIFIYIFSAFLSYCQVPTINWSRCIGGSDFDNANYCKAIPSGLLVVGSTESINGDITNHISGMDALIIKLDLSGNILWSKCLGGTGFDELNALEITFDGGIIVCGVTSSNDFDISGNHGASDYMIMKLDSSGNLLWQKCFGGTADDHAYDIHQTSDSGFIVAGESYSADGDVIGQHSCHGCNPDIWVLKLDINGNMQWQRCLGSGFAEKFGQITCVFDGGYILCGDAYVDGGDVSGTHGGFDFWIVKLNQSGVMEWSKCYGGTNDESAAALVNNSDSSVTITGEAQSVDGQVSGIHGGSDVWVIQIDYLGNLIRQNCYGGSGQDWGKSITETSNGNFLILGSSASIDGQVTNNHGFEDYWILRTNNSGTFIDQNCFGGSDIEFPSSISSIDSSECFVAGCTRSYDGDVIGHHLESGNCNILYYCRDIWIANLSFNSQAIINDFSLENKVRVSPNPGLGYFEVQCDNRIDQFSLLNILGKEIHTVSKTDNSGMNLSLYIQNKGVSFLKIQSGQKIFIKKLIVE